MHPIVAFYLGVAPDEHGRNLSEILCRNDEWLEQTHNYIQWLFPNREPSGVTPNAPTINDAVVSAFSEREELREALLASYIRMLKFYGLTLRSNGVEKGQNWNDRKCNWFTRDSHNSLRITRILKCLYELGLKREAEMFLDALFRLVNEESDSGIFEGTTRYWKGALV